MALSSEARNENTGSLRHSAGQEVREIYTLAGTLLLRGRSTAELVESLRPDSGLKAFARTPEREHRLLSNIARGQDSRLTLAYTPEGTIVGEVTIAPVDTWWQGLEGAYEIAIQVSPGWRRMGVARQLIDFALTQEPVEDLIILAVGLSWHWDYEGIGLGRFQYRSLIANLFAWNGFAEYLTAEPNIAMDPANILLARIGTQVDKEVVNHFFNCLLRSEKLPGM